MAAPVTFPVRKNIGAHSIFSSLMCPEAPTSPVPPLPGYSIFHFEAKNAFNPVTD
jgi:hypothetical protein